MAKNDKERCYYIRKGSVTVIPNDDELKELFTLANKTPFDDRVNHFAELSDINFTFVTRLFVREGFYDYQNERQTSANGTQVGTQSGIDSENGEIVVSSASAQSVRKAQSESKEEAS